MLPPKHLLEEGPTLGRSSPALLIMKCQSWILALIGLGLVEANPDAKRLYDDLLSNYNRLIRPVVNHTQKVTVKLGLRLSQLVDLVRTPK